jgi:hypothetical protein
MSTKSRRLEVSKADLHNDRSEMALGPAQQTSMQSAAKVRCEAIYQNPATPRMAAITNEAKTFNNCVGFERGFW